MKRNVERFYWDMTDHPVVSYAYSTTGTWRVEAQFETEKDAKKWVANHVGEFRIRRGPAS